MDIATLFIDLFRNIKGFFFNEDGILDKTRMVTGSAVILLFLIGGIGYLSYRLFV
ncbi:hypothetical protein [Bacillus sp. m3-13]|uniref:hypothetical protein n=1 Tax=Bacillus sp. m3-13 TaxID=406124 RepID=UPI0001E89ACF|nr:hypothetical protein [Bacillus sp. m3-13]